MKIAIIDYGAGNVKSVQFALERLGYESYCSHKPERIMSAEKIIFPGVGEASTAMKQLINTGLEKLIPKLSQGVLGICLGMQLMCDYTEEGKSSGLGIFPLKVLEFPNKVKVPHMGWNTIKNLRSSLFNGVEESAYAYFVHSYYVPTSKYSIADVNYGLSYSAALKQNNFYACQFHPEKSGSIGERILKNFLEI